LDNDIIKMDKRLLEQARERARQAREEARRMYGGGDVSQDAVRRAVESAARRAESERRDREEEDEEQQGGNQSEDEQEGGYPKGYKKLTRRVTKKSASKKASKKSAPKKASKKSASKKASKKSASKKASKKSGSKKASKKSASKKSGSKKSASKKSGSKKASKKVVRVASKSKKEVAKRSFLAEVDGKKLSGENGAARYFHGTPSAAARKVVSSEHRHGSKVDRFDNAVKIVLTEVTQGVRNAQGKHFKYSYYGWRELLKAPLKITKKQADGSGAVNVTVTAKSKVVPAKQGQSAKAAVMASIERGHHARGVKPAVKGHKRK
jgi:hypothetical protein